MLVLHRNIVALLEHLGECSGTVGGDAGTAEYYRSSGEAVLVQ